MEHAPELGVRGFALMQSKGAIQSRLYLDKHPQQRKQKQSYNKKRKRLKRAITLLETRTLRPEFTDRRDEFIEEYRECSFLADVISKWFIQESHLE